MSSLSWKTPLTTLAGWPPRLADPPQLAGWSPPGWLADPPSWLADHVMDGWGTRPLRWLSVLVSPEANAEDINCSNKCQNRDRTWTAIAFLCWKLNLMGSQTEKCKAKHCEALHGSEFTGALSWKGNQDFWSQNQKGKVLHRWPLMLQAAHPPTHRLYRKIGKSKNGNSVFFLSKTCIVEKFWYICSYLVTNFLLKLMDMLLFSTFPFLVFPYFLVLPIHPANHTERWGARCFTASHSYIFTLMSPWQRNCVLVTVQIFAFEFCALTHPARRHETFAQNSQACPPDGETMF